MIHYLNQKTQTAFNARTTKETPDCFVSIVTRREGNNEVLIHREKFSTRARAYRNAQREALWAFLCHSKIYGA